MKKPKSIVFEDTTYKKNEFALVHRLKNCDICIKTTPARYDAFVPGGADWTYLCRNHFKHRNCKLGLGQGQLLITQNEAKKIMEGST